MKIALLGGSFNPIHIGHLILADSVCCSLGYDKIVFVPTFRPPHKEMAAAISSEDRLAMVQAAVAGDSRFAVDSCEIDRGGISYTWDTVCFLEEKFADVLTGKLGVIFGEDLVPDYDKWERSRELAERADLILACRPAERVLDPRFCNAPTGKYGKNPMKDVDRMNFPYPHKIVENPLVSISSTDIRRKIAMNGSWRYLVSEGVFQYIKKGCLYGYKSF